MCPRCAQTASPSSSPATSRSSASTARSPTTSTPRPRFLTVLTGRCTGGGRLRPHVPGGGPVVRGEALLRGGGAGRGRPGPRASPIGPVRAGHSPVPHPVADRRGRPRGGSRRRLGLALAADFRVATPKTRFDCNFARLGFHHGFGAALTLPAVVGRRALELLLTGGSLRGEAALGARLCDRVVPAEDLLDAASSWPPARLAGTALRTGDPAHDAGDVRRRRLGRDAGGGCRAGGARAERRLRRSRESDGRAACTGMVGALTVPASRGAGPRTAKVQDPSREEDRWR